MNYKTIKPLKTLDIIDTYLKSCFGQIGINSLKLRKTLISNHDFMDLDSDRKYFSS